MERQGLYLDGESAQNGAMRMKLTVALVACALVGAAVGYAASSSTPAKLNTVYTFRGLNLQCEYAKGMLVRGYSLYCTTLSLRGRTIGITRGAILVTNESGNKIVFRATRNP